MPTIVPSRLQPSSTYCTWPRPCGIAIRFSERVSTHFTGRSNRSAAATDDAVFGAEAGLATERATDMRRDHAHALGVEIERSRELVHETVRHLRRHVHREVVAVAVVAGNHRDRAPLHRHDRDALVLDTRAHHDLGVGQRIVFVARHDRGREVGAELFELQRRTRRPTLLRDR